MKQAVFTALLAGFTLFAANSASAAPSHHHGHHHVVCHKVHVHHHWERRCK
jgi:Spy/CpxP family protein refolding chaperone